MKKLAVILFSTLYLVLSTGFTQYTHVCKTMAVKLYSLSSTAQENPTEPCPICMAKEKDLKSKKQGCCKHEVKVVKVDEGLKKQNHSDLSVKFWGDAIPAKQLGAVFEHAFTPDFCQPNPHFLSSKAPKQGNSIYILNCIYRI